MPKTGPRLGVFATAIAVTAIEAGKLPKDALDHIPHFEAIPSLTRYVLDEFPMERIPELVAKLPNPASWQDITAAIHQSLLMPPHPMPPTSLSLSGE